MLKIKIEEKAKSASRSIKGVEAYAKQNKNRLHATTKKIKAKETINRILVNTTKRPEKII